MQSTDRDSTAAWLPTPGATAGILGDRRAMTTDIRRIGDNRWCLALAAAMMLFAAGAAHGFDWNSIPLDPGPHSTLGDPATRRAFARSLMDARTLGRCVEGWSAPPGVPYVRIVYDLRLVSGQDSLTVEDVVILESNPSDERLNRCVVEKLRGTRHRAPGITPGRHIRIRSGEVKNLE